MAIPDHPFGIFNKIVAFFDPGAFGFLIQPEDGSGVRDEEVLLAARGVNGPYDTRIAEAEAQSDDWRGPQPTDLLTFGGSFSRSGSTQGRFQSLDVFKHGIAYATIPSEFGRISSAFFANKGDGTRNLVVIASFNSAFGGTTGLGFARWSVLTKPEGRDPSNTELFDEEDNPQGWRVIEEGLETPAEDTNGLRWSWMGVWRPNKAGTEASCLVPINTLGDILPHDQFDSPFVNCFEPDGFGCQHRDRVGDGGDQVGIGSYRFRLMRMDFGAGGSSVSLVDEGEVTGFITRSRGVESFVCEPRESFEEGDTGSSTTVTVDSKDGTLAPVAVDYDFDTDARVFAFITHDGGANSTSISTIDSNSNLNGNTVASDTKGVFLQTPDGTFEINKASATVTASITSNGAGDSIGGSFSQSGPGAFGGFQEGFNGDWRVHYLDLRFGILLLGRHAQGSPGTSWSGSAFERILASTCNHSFSYLGSGDRGEADFIVQGFIKGTKIFEYNEPSPLNEDDPSAGATFRVPIKGFGFNCCAGGGSPVFDARDTWSLEMMSARLDLPLDFASDLRRFAGVDQFLNIVISTDTYSGRFVTDPQPGGPTGLTFLSGANLIDVLNQVTYADGPLVDDGDARINFLENL